MGKTLQGSGGGGRRKLIEKWKESTWTLELKGDEIISKKRKPDNLILTTVKSKHAKLNEKLEETTKSLKELTNKVHVLEGSNKRLSTALKKKGESNCTRQKKPFSDCLAQYQRKNGEKLLKMLKQLYHLQKMKILYLLE